MQGQLAMHARSQGACSTSPYGSCPAPCAPVKGWHRASLRSSVADQRCLRRMIAAAAGAPGAGAPSTYRPGRAAAAAGVAPAGPTPHSSSPQPWDYKYQHIPGPTTCQLNDCLCLKMEALFQNVLSFPNLPPRIAFTLPKLTQDIDSMTSLVEQMAQHFGKELTIIFLMGEPKILNLPSFQAVLQRKQEVLEVMGLPEQELPQLLKKNPTLLWMPLEQIRQRYDTLPRVCRLQPQEAAFLAVKFPSVLNSPSEVVAAKVDLLMHVCGAREQWLADLQYLTPSLLAFFLRDATDLLLRLEYLASTGERPDMRLRQVFKMSDATFAVKFRHFRRWRNMVVERRKAAAAAQQQQQQQMPMQPPLAVQQQQQQQQPAAAPQPQP